MYENVVGEQIITNTYGRDIVIGVSNMINDLVRPFITLSYNINPVAMSLYDIAITTKALSIKMIETDYGSYNGESWEELCQLIYKKRYHLYQEMVASPGDWGIEGFVRGEGIAIQCYCPKRNYEAKELHRRQVKKITDDIKKLNYYQVELAKRIGTDHSDLIKEWIFITPFYKKNELLAHAQKKEKELRAFCLSFISPDVKIVLHDADHYRDDILSIKYQKGEKISFYKDEKLTILKVENPSDYDDNIERKNKVRSKKNGEYSEYRHQKLNKITREKFIEGDQLIRNIEKAFPEIYKIISRTINQYELEVEEICFTWDGSHHQLTQQIKSELKSRLTHEEKIESTISSTDINDLVDHMVSKWIALCPLEIEE